MRTMNGGYAMINLASATIHADALAALASNKPIVVYEATGAPYYADSVTTSGTSVVITKGGKTITIANDNTITNVVVKIYSVTILNDENDYGMNGFIKTTNTYKDSYDYDNTEDDLLDKYNIIDELYNNNKLESLNTLYLPIVNPNKDAYLYCAITKIANGYAIIINQDGTEKVNITITKVGDVVTITSTEGYCFVYTKLF